MVSSLIKVIAFDLDDTLYAELDYVKSGLDYVAGAMCNKLKIPRASLHQKLLDSLNIDRSNVFDRVLQEIEQLSRANINHCIKLYRSHKPKIHLYKHSKATLKVLAKNFVIYIVTDGHKAVQESKLQALGLYDSSLIKKTMITHRYGVKNAKPSTYCFQLIARKEKLKAENIVYVGDNPKKDFVGIKKLGFKTIRVHTGQHRDSDYGEAFGADYSIKNLSELGSLIEQL